MTRREPRFTPVATLGPGIPLGIYYALGRRSREILDKLRRDLMERLPKVASPMGLLRRGYGGRDGPAPRQTSRRPSPISR
jgi:hypothetical protein